MTDFTARNRLAVSHRLMTPDEIAANALDLADAVERLAHTLDDAYDAIRAADCCAEGWVNGCRALHSNVQRAQSLFAARKKAEARELIAGMASIRFEGMPARNPQDLASLTAPPIDHLFNLKDPVT
jgi:hypothetical protein